MFGTIVMLLLLTGTHIHAWGRTIEVAGGAGVVDRVGELRTRLAPLAVAELGGQMLIIAVLMNFRGLGRIWQQLRWVIVVLALAIIYRSGSRGQLIAAMMSIVMFIIFSRGTKKAFGWVAAAVSTFLILGVAAWSFLGLRRPARTLGPGQHAVGVRQHAAGILRDAAAFLGWEFADQLDIRAGQFRILRQSHPGTILPRDDR